MGWVTCLRLGRRLGVEGRGCGRVRQETAGLRRRRLPFLETRSIGDPGTWVMHVLETRIGSIVIGEPFSWND